MVSAWEDAETSQAIGLQFILWKHTLNCSLDCQSWILFDNLLQGQIGKAAWEARVAVVVLVGHLFASNLEVLGVNDDDVVTVVGMWGVSNLRFTHQLVGDNDSELA